MPALPSPLLSLRLTTWILSLGLPSAGVITGCGLGAVTRLSNSPRDSYLVATARNTGATEGFHQALSARTGVLHFDPVPFQLDCLHMFRGPVYRKGRMLGNLLRPDPSM